MTMNAVYIIIKNTCDIKFRSIILSAPTHFSLQNKSTAFTVSSSKSQPYGSMILLQKGCWVTSRSGSITMISWATIARNMWRGFSIQQNNVCVWNLFIHKDGVRAPSSGEPMQRFWVSYFTTSYSHTSVEMYRKCATNFKTYWNYLFTLSSMIYAITRILFQWSYYQFMWVRLLYFSCYHVTLDLLLWKRKDFSLFPKINTGQFWTVTPQMSLYVALILV